MNLKKIIFLGSVLSITIDASADQFHYANFQIGERAMGLGGAFTAVSDDASGIFYNPAGLGFALNSDISGSANAYYSKETVYKNAIGNKNFTEKSSGTANPFFGGLQKLDHIMQGLAAGFAVYITDNEFKDQDDLYTNIDLGSGLTLDRYHRTANTRSETLGIAIAGAKKFRGGLSLGFGLSYLTATELTQNYQDVQESNSSGSEVHTTLNTRVKLDAGAIETAFGAQYAISTVSIGLNIKVRTIINQSLDLSQDQSRAINNVAQTPGNFSYNYDDPLESWPNEYRFGLAWFATTRLLLTADVSYHTGTDDVDGDGQDQTKDLFRQKYGREATTNYAGGLEYYITSSVPIRVGVFTNKDARPKIEKGETDQMDHIDYMGYSLFFAWVQPNSQISIGAIYQDGKGESQKIAGSEEIQDVVSGAYTVALSATHSL